MRLRYSLLTPTILSFSLTGCVLPYYMQAVGGQVSLMRQRVPITEVVVDESYAVATRQQLALVTRLRRFAVDQLALPDNKSYTSYVDLGRNFVVWNVIAADEFSLTPVTWCFPVAGCVAYRGYFDPADAENFAAKLRKKGLDTYTGGSPAYSTLGYFADPVLNTMLTRGEAEIAGMLFHELAHQRVYVKGDTELSESFATAVEQYAVELWLATNEQSEALEAYRARLHRHDEFSALIAAQRERLAQVFAAADEPAAMRRAKSDAYAQMHRDYAALKSRWNGRGDYDGWFDGGFNNARLVALTSYQRWVPGLRARLEVLGPDNFYAAVESLSKLAPAVRDETLTAWNDASEMAALADLGQTVDTAIQVRPDDGLHAFRHYAERGKTVFATDTRDRQRTEIVATEWLARQQVLADEGLETSQRSR